MSRLTITRHRLHIDTHHPGRPAARQQMTVTVKKKPTITRAAPADGRPPARAARATPPPAPPPLPVPTPSVRHTLQAVIQKQRARAAGAMRRQDGPRKQPKYITHDVGPGEQSKIRNIRGRGAGRILLIIGNGPSISEAPLELLHGHPYVDTMSINKPDQRLWPTTYWTFFDQTQLRRHRQLLDGYAGVVFNSTAIKEDRPNGIRMKSIREFGFSLDLMRGLNIGRSSVYAAMQIGLWMDYAHIYLFGVDMCEVGGKTHFYGDNPDAPRDVRLGRFDKEAEYYADAAGRLDEVTRSRFTFCSTYNTYGFVEEFGRADQREAPALIMAHAGRLHTPAGG